MNIEDIARLAEVMSEHELSEISFQDENVKLKLRRGMEPVVVSAPALAAPAASPAAPQGLARDGDPAGDSAAASSGSGCTINSPIVGTFYQAPGPDMPSFVEIGDRVDPDTVVCIVEAMKVMNEIKAEQSGIIRRRLVENATAVEYGQPLFEVEPV